MLHIPASRLAICLYLTLIAPAVVIVALIYFMPQQQTQLTQALIFMSCLWLGACGSIHWGHALRGADSPRDIYAYAYSIMPLIYAMAIITYPPKLALFALFLGFFTSFYIDRKISYLPNWYISLRSVTSFMWFILLYAAYYALKR